MKKEDTLFHLAFTQRFSKRNVFLPLTGMFSCGIFAGSIAVIGLDLFRETSPLPTLFSGIPLLGAGFLSHFYTFLLNLLIGLIILFLLGITAFGAVAVPAFLFCKGATIGIGILSFYMTNSISGWGSASLCYAPDATASGLLLLFFATRSMIFSNGLARAGFSSQKENLDFHVYFKDFLSFLCFAVAVSLGGALLATLCESFM